MQLQKYYPTVVLSDIHLGSDHSKTKEVTRYLQQVRCDKLILNGDIIDGWQLKKSLTRWKPVHTGFFKVLMKMMESHGTEIIYVRGNHDDFLDALIPFRLYNIQIVSDYTFHSSTGKTYYVTHGDVFDTITTSVRWLAVLGDVGYDTLLWMNKQFNRWREKQGKPYFSMSGLVKQKVKSAVAYISDFEKELVKLAQCRKVDGIICGHIHQAANCYYDSIHYLNSGDWVESMTALVEREDGEWEILEYRSETAEEIEPWVVDNALAVVI